MGLISQESRWDGWSANIATFGHQLYKNVFDMYKDANHAKSMDQYPMFLLQNYIQ